jgi:SHS2 domain-containing protein
MYELFEHTSDLGLRVRAPRLDTLFREAAEGLFSMITEEWLPDRPAAQHDFSLRAENRETLLFDWLNELLYTFHTDHVLLSSFEVRIDGLALEARAAGTQIDHSAHKLLHEVKAITYHGLKVEREGEGWLAEVIVDI